MTSAAQLDAACKGVSGFLGVFSSDTLPSSFLPGQSLIVNYDPANKPGSHWVAMKRSHAGESLFFDSFGMPPDAEDNILHDQTHFGKWLENSKGPIRHNEFDFQAIFDDQCGQWATLFVRIGVLPPPPPTDRLRLQSLTLRGGGTHHIRETQGAKNWLPFMKGSAVDRDARVKRWFDTIPTMIAGRFAQPARLPRHPMPLR